MWRIYTDGMNWWVIFLNESGELWVHAVGDCNLSLSDNEPWLARPALRNREIFTWESI